MTEAALITQLQGLLGPGLASTAIILMLVYGSKLIKPTLAGADAHAGLIDKLQKEAGKWQELYDETHRLLQAQRETNTLLRSQNAMMRMLLIQKGISESELIAIGAIHPTEYHAAGSGDSQ